MLAVAASAVEAALIRVRRDIRVARKNPISVPSLVSREELDRLLELMQAA
jgi:hypothetical protein